MGIKRDVNTDLTMRRSILDKQPDKALSIREDAVEIRQQLENESNPSIRLQLLERLEVMKIANDNELAELRRIG